MRISDWSSDVCSSDLVGSLADLDRTDLVGGQEGAGPAERGHLEGLLRREHGRIPPGVLDEAGHEVGRAHEVAVVGGVVAVDAERSEESRVGNECVSACRSRGSPYL